MSPHRVQIEFHVREMETHLRLLRQSQRELKDALRTSVELSRTIRAQLDEARSMLAEDDGNPTRVFEPSPVRFYS